MVVIRKSVLVVVIVTAGIGLIVISWSQLFYWVCVPVLSESEIYIFVPKKCTRNLKCCHWIRKPICIKTSLVANINRFVVMLVIIMQKCHYMNTYYTYMELATFNY